jgi:SOS-response transcriptional repressor LexA
VNDVVIGDFQMPWEKKDAFWRWATDDSGMEQVGTVYTAQGFEYDYMAVIFGNDLVYDASAGNWKPVPEKSHDTQVRRNNPKLKEHLSSVYRVLLSRAHKGVYVYFMDKGTEAYFRKQLARPVPFGGVAERVEESAPAAYQVISLEDARVKREAFRTLLPLYSLKAAAGYFGSGESVEPEGWVNATSVGHLTKEMFVARAVGRSMEPRIPDGALCVFRANPQGSRQGKIVLVQHRGVSDPETGGAFTVKRYRSEKAGDGEGGWRHEQITLDPINPEYQPIVLRPRSEGDVVVVAELVDVLT